MLGYSELLTGSELSPPEQSLAFAVHLQVRRTRELVANLLSFASQSPARISSVDLNSLVETAVRLLRLQLDARAISTKIDQDHQLPSITADSSQILRVVLHLAAQICSQKKPDAPTSLNIETLAQGEMAVLQLSCDAHVEGSRAWILVGQNGVDSGSLSLSACRRIVSDHGGRIFIEQSNDGPIAFRIEFPSSAKSAGTAANLTAVPAVASVRS
jgi:nitrogen-specific signal transduction histidine kinase